MRFRVLICLLLWAALGGTGCSAYELVRYVLFPDFPKFAAGDAREIRGLREPVEVALRGDGLWRIEARNEHDAILAAGYLQARDRMAQLDIFRHMARGELAALLGNQVMAGSSTLELDIRNRFLGFRERGERLYRATSAEEREALEAFAQGVNGWIDERHLSLEHRLLGVDRVRAWTPLDSLAIYGFIMHGLGGNADREIRRLRIACEAGLEALERIWPQDIEFEALALPEEDQPAESHPPQPAVVPELAAELAELCAAAASDRHAVLQALREELAGDFCAGERSQGETSKLWEARRLLCQWDGDMAANSSAATLYTLLTHALLDHALADELPGESGREVWEYAQSLLQFEANVAWLWSRPERAPVWDDARTSETETRNDILRTALAEAVALGDRRWGHDLDGWAWGEVRPFVLKHLFASKGGLLGRILNAPPMSIPGGTETPFKQQFPRADREHMDPAVGPLVRFSVDMADPWAATYSLAGGESGWPRSPRYANLLQDWRTGRGRPLTPPASKQDVRVELVPRR